MKCLIFSDVNKCLNTKASAVPMISDDAMRYSSHFTVNRHQFFVLNHALYMVEDKWKNWVKYFSRITDRPQVFCHVVHSVPSVMRISHPTHPHLRVMELDNDSFFVTLPQPHKPLVTLWNLRCPVDCFVVSWV